MNKKGGTLLGILFGIILAVVALMAVSLALDFNIISWLLGLLQKAVC